MSKSGRAIKLAVLMGCVAVAMGSETQSEKGSMEPGNGSILFKLESGNITIDIGALNAMKTALQSFIGGSDFPPRFSDRREPMSEELKPSAAWIHHGEAGIGLWKLELQDRRLELVRRPPPVKGTHYIYHAGLTRVDSGWKIASFEVEREFGPH
jgi:hypothetical protein